jgi:HEAT repeat protein
VAAEALASRPSAAGAQMAKTLLGDHSAAVQVAVVGSVTQWPLAQGGPILVAALRSNARVTRQAAAETMTARWPPAASFPIDGNPKERASAADRLESALRDQFPPDSNKLVAEPEPASLRSAATAEEVAEAERSIEDLASAAPAREKEEAARRLAAQGPRLVEVLELVTARSASPLPETVYRGVLPQCAPEFAALARFRSDDLAARRSAADELAAIGQRQPLGRLALERLRVMVEVESDPVVWRAVFSTIANDASEPSARLAYAASQHPAPEVRRMACTHLVAHPGPKHAPVLLRALNDSHSEVVRQAVRALGMGGGLEDCQTLKRMLGSADESLRVEVAMALARLGDESGPPALERLAHSNDPIIRRQTAAAMGQVPSPVYKASLIGLLDDQYSIRVAALESLSKIGSPEDSASDPAQQGTTDEQVGRWKKARH